jgi:hypothetical protein
MIRHTVARNGAAPQQLVSAVTTLSCPSWDRTRTLLIQRKRHREKCPALRGFIAAFRPARRHDAPVNTRRAPGQCTHSGSGSHGLSHRQLCRVARRRGGGIMTARSRPTRITPSPLSPAVLSVLRRMVDGEPLFGQRTFPHPFRFHIGNVDDSRPVPATAVSALVEAQLIDPLHPSPLSDVVRYRVTDAGTRVAQNGPPAPDDGQLDLLGGVA